MARDSVAPEAPLNVNTRVVFHLLALVGLVVLLSSCPGPVTNTETPFVNLGKYTLDLHNFPEDESGWTFHIRTFDKDSNLVDSIDVPKKSSSLDLSKDITISTNAIVVGEYLIDDFGTAQYFTGFDLTAVTSDQLVEYYWTDYSQYFDFGNYSFGPSSKNVADLPMGTIYSFDFTDAPYYLLRVPSDTGKSYQFEQVVNAGSVNFHLYQDVSTWIGQGDSDWLTGDSTLLTGVGSPQYLYVVPASYTISNNISLRYSDVTQAVSQTFTPAFSATVDDGASILFADNGSDFNPTSGKLKSMDLTTGDVTEVKDFPSAKISAMVSIGSDLYVASGKDVSKYVQSTNTWTTVGTFVGNIKFLSAIATTHLFVNDDSGDWSTFSLVRLSDNVVLDTETLVHPSTTGFWIPEQGRLYMDRDGSPSDVCYVEIDLNAGTLGTYGDSPYHGTYSNMAPFERYGSGLLLVDGSGELFSLNDSTASKILYLQKFPYTNVGSVSQAGKVIFLEQRGTKSVLASYSDTNPYTAIKTIASWPGETSLQLLQSSEGLLVINKTTSTGRLVVRLVTTADLAADAPDHALKSTKSTRFLKVPREP